MPSSLLSANSGPWVLGSSRCTRFSVTIGLSTKTKIGFAFRWAKKQRRLKIEHTTYYSDDSGFEVSEDTLKSDMAKFLVNRLGPHREVAGERMEKDLQKADMQVVRSRAFLELAFNFANLASSSEVLLLPTPLSFRTSPYNGIVNCISEVIHLPGLRGNPETDLFGDGGGPLISGHL